MRISFPAVVLIFFFFLVGTGCKKTGPQGATGATGAAGAVGPAGANGSVIYSGSTTPGATLGNVGDFYMDLSTSTLYGPKTATGWGSGFSLKGDTGAAGGNGATGATGAAGKAGTQIYAGSGVPASTLGVPGDFYMDTVAHDLYGPKQTSGWGVPIALQGPAGAAGSNGATGPQGPQGPAGPAGPTGTANVLYTNWVYPGGGNWKLVAGYGGQNVIEHTETIPAITAAAINTGMILCYADLEDYVTQIWPTGQVELMPITVMYKNSGTEYIDNWQASYQTGSSTIEMYNDQSFFNQNSFAYSRFRWVIIPAGATNIPGSLPRQQKNGHGNPVQ